MKVNELKFNLYFKGELVGHETHVIDPAIGHMGIYHKRLDEKKYKAGYPITMGDSVYIFHDEKELICP